MKMLNVVVGFYFIVCSFFVFAENSWSPYVGFDMQQRNMNFVKNYGNNVFSRKPLQNNLYLGLKISKNFGLEAGYQSSQKCSKTAMILGGDYLLGQFVNPPVTPPNMVPFVLTETSIQIKGPHLSVIGFLPLKNEQTQLIGSMGVSVPTIKFQYKQLADSELGSYALEDIVDTTRNFRSRRAIPRYMFGIQQKFTDSLGFRVSVSGELTRKFRQMASKDDSEGVQLLGNHELRASIRNTITYGLGLFATF